ncbi:MAG: glycosyltransferase, partial [Flavobacterium sp.]
GLPMSVLEAMSSGMPMVLSNIKGCVSLIQNNGFLADNNVTSIEEGILKTIKNIEKFSINSKDLFDKNYNLLVNKNKYLELYQSLIK